MRSLSYEVCESPFIQLAEVLEDLTSTYNETTHTMTGVIARASNCVLVFEIFQIPRVA